jgi:hypothetical protein
MKVMMSGVRAVDATGLIGATTVGAAAATVDVDKEIEVEVHGGIEATMALERRDNRGRAHPLGA